MVLEMHGAMGGTMRSTDAMRNHIFLATNFVYFVHFFVHILLYWFWRFSSEFTFCPCTNNRSMAINLRFFEIFVWNHVCMYWVIARYLAICVHYELVHWPFYILDNVFVCIFFIGAHALRIYFQMVALIDYVLLLFCVHTCDVCVFVIFIFLFAYRHVCGFFHCFLSLSLSLFPARKHIFAFFICSRCILSSKKEDSFCSCETLYIVVDAR